MADVKEDGPTSPDVHFEPIVKLAPVEIKTLEENEEEVFRIRAKLFRYCNTGESTEWKERGVGDIKILKSNNDESKYRLVMRREKTFKLCANHYLLPTMELKANCDSDRAFVWNTPADFADEEPKAETLAIRFANAENAKKFKTAFEDCQKCLTNAQDEKKDEEKPAEEDADAIADKLGEMKVKDESKKDDEKSDSESKTKENGDAKEENKKDTDEKEK